MKGVVFDPVNGRNMANINIFTKDMKIGTVSSYEGDFSIKIPKEYVGGYLYFTGIGYKKDSVLIKDGDSTVQLLPEVYELKEIYVMPDSTLLTLLRKAYNRIPYNYPTIPTAYQGFYRESIQDENRKQVDFTEAVLGVYKESYQKKAGELGQLQIVKSRKKNIQDIGLMYYGGPFLVIDGDAVLAKADYIDPNHFKEYSYQFNGIMALGDRSFYKIDFLKNQKDTTKIYSGTMLIDKESLAYFSFEIYSNYNSNPLRTRDAEKDIKITYDFADDKWFLKSYTYTNKHTDRFNGKHRFAIIEYLTTYCQKDSVYPIPYETRLKFLDAISVKADKYNKKGWTDYDDLKRGHLHKTDFQFSEEDSRDIFQNQHAPVGVKVRKNLFSILSKINMSVGVGYKPVTVSPVHAELQFAPDANILPFSIDREHKRLQENVLMDFSIGCRITNSFNIHYKESLDLFDEAISSNSKSIGIDWQKNIINSGNPVFVSASCIFNFRSFFADLGSYDNHDTFHYKGKKFDAKQLKFDYGMRQNTFSPQFALSKKLARLLEIKAYIAYHFQLSQKEVFRMKEKDGFFLSRKSVTVPSDNKEIKMVGDTDLWKAMNINELQVGICFIFN